MLNFFTWINDKITNTTLTLNNKYYFLLKKKYNKKFENIKIDGEHVLFNRYYRGNYRELSSIKCLYDNLYENFNKLKIVVECEKSMLSKLNKNHTHIFDYFALTRFNNNLLFIDLNLSTLKWILRNNIFIQKIRKPTEHEKELIKREPYTHEYNQYINDFNSINYSDLYLSKYNYGSNSEFIDLWDDINIKNIKPKDKIIYDFKFNDLFLFKRYMSIRQIRGINFFRTRVEDRKQINVNDFYIYTENKFSYKTFKKNEDLFYMDTNTHNFKIYDNSFNFFLEKIPYITLDYKLPRYYYYWDSKKDKLIYNYNLSKNKCFFKNNLLNDCTTRLHYTSWDNIPRYTDPNPFEWKLMNDWMWEDTWSTYYTNKENEFFLVWFHRWIEESISDPLNFFEEWYFFEGAILAGWITDNLVGFYFVFYILWGPMDVIWVIWKYYMTYQPIEFFTWYFKWRFNYDYFS